MLKVALLCGGKSAEREVSLKGGQAVEKALKSLGHQFKRFDPATDLPLLAREAQNYDVAFLVLHGPGGEDGTIQGFLDSLGLPYQGAGVLGSALAMDKALSKILYQQAGLLVPKGLVLEKGKTLPEIDFFPVVVKPVSQGSSVGISLVKGPDELALAVEEAFEIEDRVLIEEYLAGRELTVGILGEEPLPVVEIIPGEGHAFFDYEAKYTPGVTQELCPAPIPESLAKEAQKAALQAHQALRLRHYSRTDFILLENKLYILETNTIPGMTETSLLPLAAKVAGYSFEDLVQKLLDLVLATA
ncbi:D-alanine--D-alanine ligase family protein [Thermodesulfatator autotrophicus]|uniref:D-alanine--D-alanine ligase n=1 Tax=Thermodesulfatator autotrophicus TaxID=1795632 RepID=A0A177E7S7_9BACT|nr:D-alanine--D-alanine ligase [Thermodesulfatator autotrophicus]OAG27490.1 D-alanine--D-alanine ligase [Thermodesulfatator autotrophicus]